MMNTSWDDDGESLFEIQYGIVWAPQLNGKGRRRPVLFDRSFDWAFFRNDSEQFAKRSALGSVNAAELNVTSDLFWRDPFTTAFKTSRGRPEKFQRMRFECRERARALLQIKNSRGVTGR